MERQNRRPVPGWGRMGRKSLLGILCACLLASPLSVRAAGTGEEADGIGVSMYDVSTALTAYVNNVVGSNTNDKHNSHEMEELKGNGIQPGDAGSLLGFGDEDKGFYGYISSPTAQGATSTDYDALLSVGDKGKTYCYARYGRLLADLGLDDTAASHEGSTMRKVFGLFMRAVFALASFVPQVFGLVLTLLSVLNPFRFFLGNNASLYALSDGSATVLDNHANVSAFGHLVQQSIGNTGSVGGMASTLVNDLTKGLTEIYELAQGIGIFGVVPLTLGLLLWTVLARSSRAVDKTGKAMTFLKRVVLIIVAVPFCGIFYTSTLNTMTEAVLTKPMSAKITACTFVDFQSWVDNSRLLLPAGTTLVSVGKSDVEGESIASAGSADNNTVRTLRDTVLTLNKATGVVDYDMGGLGITSDSSSYSISGGMWNTDGLVEDLVANGPNAALGTRTEKKLGSMLDRYASGNFYHASAFETGVNGVVSKNYKSSLGSTPGTSNAGSNVGMVYEMYDETNEVSDWMNREIPDNASIFNGTSWPTFNIFGNGVMTSTEGLSDSVQNTTRFTYTGQAWTNVGGLDPTKQGGLSSVAMYNYLSTKFDDTSVMTYSAIRSTSEYTKEAHFAVNLIGSGALRIVYAINCVAVLGVFVLIGFIYGFGMLIGNAKRSLHLIVSIPVAVMGSLKALVQLFVYTFAMIAELLITVCVYEFACELIMMVATITERAVNEAAKNAAAVVVGGRFGMAGAGLPAEAFYDSHLGFVLGLLAVSLLVLAMGYGCYRAYRPVLAFHRLFWLAVAYFWSFREMRETVLSCIRDGLDAAWQETGSGREPYPLRIGRMGHRFFCPEREVEA